MFLRENRNNSNSFCFEKHIWGIWALGSRGGWGGGEGRGGAVFSATTFNNFHAPNFKEVGGAFCFWGVRPSGGSSCFLMHSMTLEICMPLFWNFLFRFLLKSSWYVFFSSTVLCPFPELWPFEKNMDEILSAKYLKNHWR